MSAIEKAIEMLRHEAEALKNCHTINGEWRGDPVQEEYEQMLATADAAVEERDALRAELDELKVQKDEALNTLCKVFHAGEEFDGPDGMIMAVDLALWNDGCEAIELLVGGEEGDAAPGAPDVTDAMALAFHSALTDGSIGQDEVDEIKIGLRAALAAAPKPEAQDTDPDPGPQPGDLLAWGSQAVLDVAEERRRQIEAEGWTPEHDDEHEGRDMARAAACYALHAAGYPDVDVAVLRFWPWLDTRWKPSTPRRNLVKAGALILAEIERLDRAAP